MRLGDLDALKEALTNTQTSLKYMGVFTVDDIKEFIDSAPTVDFEKLGESLNCQIRAKYGSCDDCELSCPRNELIKLLDSERPQGEWVRKPNEHRVDICCTNCGYDDGYSCFKYCPNCGAKMKGGAELGGNHSGTETN